MTDDATTQRIRNRLRELHEQTGVTEDEILEMALLIVQRKDYGGDEEWEDQDASPSDPQ